MHYFYKIACLSVCLAPMFCAVGCDEKTPLEEPVVPVTVEPFSIVISASEHGSAVATIDGQPVAEATAGSVVTLTATSDDPDVHFESWTITSKNISLPRLAQARFVMPAGDVALTPQFSATTYYPIVIHSGFPRSFVSATIFVDGVEANRAAAGDEVTITAEEEPGYEFGFWMLANGDTGAAEDDITADYYALTTTFLMPEYPIAIDCQVQKNAYWVRVSNDGNGHATVGLLPGSNAFYWGSNVQIVPIPKAGYKFKAWTEVVGLEGVNPTANPLNIVTPMNEVTMKATFEAE